jgi:hypothetical protein
MYEWVHKEEDDLKNWWQVVYKVYTVYRFESFVFLVLYIFFEIITFSVYKILTICMSYF